MMRLKRQGTSLHAWGEREGWSATLSIHRHPERPEYRRNAILRGGRLYLPFVTAGITINQRRDART